MPSHMNRKAAKRDTAEPAIVAALKKAGCSVVKLSDTGVPDLLVAYPMQWPASEDDPNYDMVLMEVKTGNARLTEDEEKFFDTWKGARIIVRTPQQALTYIGVPDSEFHLYID